MTWKQTSALVVATAAIGIGVSLQAQRPPAQVFQRRALRTASPPSKQSMQDGQAKFEAGPNGSRRPSSA